MLVHICETSLLPAWHNAPHAPRWMDSGSTHSGKGASLVYNTPTDRWWITGRKKDKEHTPTKNHNTDELGACVQATVTFV